MTALNSIKNSFLIFFSAICNLLSCMVCVYNIQYYTLFTDIELVPSIVLIHCTLRGCMPRAIDFSQGFWYGTLPRPFTIEGAKLLTTSTSAVEWYKSRAYTSFLSEVIQIFICANST